MGEQLVMDEQLIAVIPKNATEEYRVKLTEYHGRRYVDARVYISKWGHNHEPRPTRKGLTISPDKLGAVIEALQQAEAVVQGRAPVEAPAAPVETPDPPHGEHILAAG